MSKLVEINWQPDDRTLRQFGGIALAGFGLLAILAWNEMLVFSRLFSWLSRIGLTGARPIVAGTFGGLGILSAFFSLIAPQANKPIFLGLTLLSYPIGFVLSYVIMGFLFYGLFTPLGLVFRLLGKDPMNRGFDRQAATYWTDARPRRGKESYFRQF